MLLPALDLDARMRVDAVLERLALNGFWCDARDEAALRRLRPLALRLDAPLAGLARQLARDPCCHGAAIRRQAGTRLYWHALRLDAVLARCAQAPAAAALGEVLRLEAGEEADALALRDASAGLQRTCVLLQDGMGVAVWIAPPRPAAAAAPQAQRRRSAALSVSRSPEVPSAVPEAASPGKAWPRIDAPAAVHAGKPFDVVVGLAAAPREGVGGAAFDLPFPAGKDTLDVRIELAAEGVEAPEGWSRVLCVARGDLSAEVRFRLVGAPPAPDPAASLTMLEVRYTVGGQVCGTASRPLVVLSAAESVPEEVAQDWRAVAPTASAVAFVPDDHVPDLTIEISKPGRNAAQGNYVCVLRSPHALDIDPGPFPMDLGQDARTFARAMVDEIRLFAASELLEDMIKGHGELVASRLPRQAFDAIRRVAARVGPAAPSVLIVSAEPYVPWELAWMDRPLDPARPPFLGAQALVGRWLRDEQPGGDDGLPRPAPHPCAEMQVGNLAVLAAHYQAATGLARLFQAEQEARAIAQGFPSTPLPATAQALRQLLRGTVMKDFAEVPVDAVHFAGHGDFDPARPDGSAMYLEDGTPLRSTLFRAAQFGGKRQPVLFLNACMLGVGGELLGDMGGFPGNALRGGFGGVLGALWEVDDQRARDIALEFWERALPAAPARGEPVGAILRDLRATYATAQPHPQATCLAYVYYGHPLLTLRRA